MPCWLRKKCFLGQIETSVTSLLYVHVYSGSSDSSCIAAVVAVIRWCGWAAAAHPRSFTLTPVTTSSVFIEDRRTLSWSTRRCMLTRSVLLVMIDPSLYADKVCLVGHGRPVVVCWQGLSCWSWSTRRCMLTRSVLLVMVDPSWYADKVGLVGHGRPVICWQGLSRWLTFSQHSAVWATYSLLEKF